MKDNAATFRVSAMCRALSVSRSGYYEWRHRPLSQHSQENQALAVQIQGHVDHSRQVYGTRRLKVFLAEDGEQVSRRRKDPRLSELHRFPEAQSPSCLNKGGSFGQHATDCALLGA